jgi:hypothetical protein
MDGVKSQGGGRMDGLKTEGCLGAQYSAALWRDLDAP